MITRPWNRTSILDGIDITVLQAKLTMLQTVYFELISGAMVSRGSYAQGDNERQITFVQADIGTLTQSIIALQTQIDRLNGLTINHRPPIRPFF
jgi:hypothetical protein